MFATRLFGFIIIQFFFFDFSDASSFFFASISKEKNEYMNIGLVRVRSTNFRSTLNFYFILLLCEYVWSIFVLMAQLTPVCLVGVVENRIVITMNR